MRNQLFFLWNGTTEGPDCCPMLNALVPTLPGIHAGKPALAAYSAVPEMWLSTRADTVANSATKPEGLVVKLAVAGRTIATRLQLRYGDLRRMVAEARGTAGEWQADELRDAAALLHYVAELMLQLTYEQVRVLGGKEWVMESRALHERWLAAEWRYFSDQALG